MKTQPQPKPITAQCDSCRYARLNPQDIRAYECMAKPPTAVPIASGNGQMQVIAIRPPVRGDDWCAEFTVRPIALN